MADIKPHFIKNKHMKVLFIGGTGIISSACSELAISRGIDLYHLNRGKSANLRTIEGVKHLRADIRNFEESKQALEAYTFDVVVDWIAFEPQHILNDIKLFTGKTKQFVFISSASAYQTPPEKLPITEETPLYNPFWEYSRNKIACEEILRNEFIENGFPYTIVRPSHTYDKTLIPVMGDYTFLDRLKKGLPVVVHGDGTSVWTLTHHKDFAKGLVGLLGKLESINQAYHITNDELLTWDNIVILLARELNVEPKIVHVPSEVIAQYDKEIGDGLLGDKMHSMIFDNAKIKFIVPDFKAEISFTQGAKEIISWYESDPKRQVISEVMNNLMDTIIADYQHLKSSPALKPKK
jgi:nucleoside-diphosphate-sugar epimerase